jgi:hypothetical protein
MEYVIQSSKIYSLSIPTYYPPAFSDNKRIVEFKPFSITELFTSNVSKSHMRREGILFNDFSLLMNNLNWLQRSIDCSQTLSDVEFGILFNYPYLLGCFDFQSQVVPVYNDFTNFFRICYHYFNIFLTNNPVYTKVNDFNYRLMIVLTLNLHNDVNLIRGIISTYLNDVKLIIKKHAKLQSILHVYVNGAQVIDNIVVGSIFPMKSVNQQIYILKKCPCVYFRKDEQICVLFLRDNFSQRHSKDFYCMTLFFRQEPWGRADVYEQFDAVEEFYVIDTFITPTPVKYDLLPFSLKITTYRYLYLNLPCLAPLSPWDQYFSVGLRDFVFSDEYDNTHTKTYLMSEGLITNIDDVTKNMNWIQAQSAYFFGLTIREQYVVQAYTYHGDTILNAYLRNNFDFSKDIDLSPFYFQVQDLLKSGIFNLGPFFRPGLSFREFSKYYPILLENLKSSHTMPYFSQLCKSLFNTFFYSRILNGYNQELNKIIQESPPVENKLDVFRGTHDDHWLKFDSNREFTTKDYWSTSICLNIANQFANKDCCVHKITLLPGCKCLLIMYASKFPNESEILLGPGNKYLLTTEKMTINLPIKHSTKTKTLLLYPPNSKAIDDMSI